MGTTLLVIWLILLFFFLGVAIGFLKTVDVVFTALSPEPRFEEGPSGRRLRRHRYYQPRRRLE